MCYPVTSRPHWGYEKWACVINFPPWIYILVTGHQINLKWVVGGSHTSHRISNGEVSNKSQICRGWVSYRSQMEHIYHDIDHGIINICRLITYKSRKVLQMGLRWVTYGLHESQMDLKWFTDRSHTSHRIGLQMCHRWVIYESRKVLQAGHM